MLSTKARPITRHEYAMIPVGAPNQQLTRRGRANRGGRTLDYRPGKAHEMLPGLTINLAEVFAA